MLRGASRGHPVGRSGAALARTERLPERASGSLARASAGLNALPAGSNAREGSQGRLESASRSLESASRSLERPGWGGHATGGIERPAPGGIERPAAASRGHRPAGHATFGIGTASAGLDTPPSGSGPPAPGWSRHRRDREASTRRDRERQPQPREAGAGVVTPPAGSRGQRPAGSRGQRPAGSRGQPQPREATARLDTPPSGSGPPAPASTRHLRIRTASAGVSRHRRDREPAPDGIERPAAASRGHRPAGHATGEIRTRPGRLGARSDFSVDFRQRRESRTSRTPVRRPSSPPRQDGRSAVPGAPVRVGARSIFRVRRDHARVPRFLGIEAKKIEVATFRRNAHRRGSAQRSIAGLRRSIARDPQGEASGR